MQNSIRKTINLNLDHLLAAEDLERAVKNLQIDCLSNSSEQNKGELTRYFWLTLAKQSVISGNITLATLTAKELKLNKLMIPSHSSDQRLNETNDQHSLLRYMANYLQIGSENGSVDQPSVDSNNSMASCENSLKQFLDQYDWAKALEWIGSGSMPSHQQDKLKILVSEMQARYYENEENFSESVSYYEKSNTQAIHSPRVLLKHLMNSAYHVLEDYCSTTSSLRDLWPKYLMACGKLPEAAKYFENQRNIHGQLRCYILSSNLKQGEVELFKMLPERLQQFISKPDPNIWFDEKRIVLIGSIGSSLSSSHRAALYELSNFHLTQNNMLKSCCIDLCLKEYDTFLLKSTSLLDHLRLIQLTTRFGSDSQLTSQLMDYLREQQYARTNNRTSQSGLQILFMAYLKLGLIDECLRILARTSQRDLIDLNYTVDFISKQISTRHNSSLDDVNPEIRVSTIRSLQESLVNESDIELTTNVITIVILSLNIFLIKLEINDIQILDESITKLESMFQNLSELFNEMSFNASEALIKATNGLVAAVKARLDALIDSNLIREGFQQLIETTAGRCMIEGRYKNAAMLYSQIEDNVNAVKSLMRTGEIDTVIDYALLVRDITVNRITINYLRHLNTNQEVIEDFIARSKT